jgi:transposase-like protein
MAPKKVEFNDDGTVNEWAYYGADNIVCPYCGCESQDEDHLLYDGNCHQWDCSECGKEFTVEAQFSVSYTSVKKEESPR